MPKLVLVVLLFISSISLASENIEINNINSRYFKNNSTLVIYCNFINKADKLDYLLNLEIIDHPEAIATINKTVIEQNIARIIKIDRLAIPAHSTVNLNPLGIYIVIHNLTELNGIRIKFHLNHNLNLQKEIFIQKAFLTNYR